MNHGRKSYFLPSDEAQVKFQRKKIATAKMAYLYSGIRITHPGILWLDELSQF